ncbi:MAG: ATP-dependent DNA ligase, partial [Acidimicrobiales bacterium]|nr:ATP-dependent DNA ligase [Acidimicrobiales bacterium]
MPTVPVLLAEVVATSAEVAATRSRTAKRDLLAALLRRLGPDEIVPTVGFLTGEPVQGRIGVGWRTLAAARDDGARPAALATLTVTEVDATLADLAGLRGPGSNAARRARVVGLLARATDDEATFLFRLLTGELRQGALAGVVTDAVAAAAGVPTAPVRRAAMLGGDLPLIARLAMVEGADGLGRVQLRPGRPVQPMLASTADDVAAAVGALGTAVVDWKLDGIRVQVHRTAGEVRAWTRNLNEITDRLPEVCDLVAGWPGGDLVLDGEALVVDSDLRPVPFQDTASRVGGDDPDRVRAGGQGVRPWFFDLLHRDGVDLIDAPLTERRAALRDLAGSW